MIKTRIDRRRRPESHYYHQPLYWDSVARALLIKGKSIHQQFFVTHIVLMKIFNRDYAFCVFFDNTANTACTRKHEDIVKETLKDFFRNYLSERIMMVFPYGEYHRVYLLEEWGRAVDLEILKQWDGHTQLL